MQTIFEYGKQPLSEKIKSQGLAVKLSSYLSKKVDEKIWLTIDDVIHISGYCSEQDLNYEFRVTAYIEGDLYGHWVDLV